MDLDYDENTDDEDSSSDDDDWQNSVATTDIDTTDVTDGEYDAEVFPYHKTWGVYLNYLTHF